MRTPNWDRKCSLCGLLLIAVSLAACGDDLNGNESLGVTHLAVNQSTITFDESGLPAGTAITTQFQAQGLIFSPPGNASVRIVDDAMVGSWPTDSGEFYLAINTVPAVPPGAVVTATFVDPCGQPTTTDTLSLIAVDSNPVP